MAASHQTSKQQGSATTNAWAEETLQRLYQSALNGILGAQRVKLFRDVAAPARVRSQLQHHQLPAIPQRMVEAVNRPQGWVLGQLAGEVLDAHVRQHNETPFVTETETLASLHAAARALDQHRHCDGCARLWLVWLLASPEHAPLHLLAELLLRSDGTLGLRAIRPEPSPYPSLSEAWHAGDTKLDHDHPCWKRTGPELRDTLLGTREDPPLHAWLTGIVSEPSSPLEQLTEAHGRALDAVRRLAADLEGDGFGRPDDLEPIVQLRRLVTELAADHGPLGADLASAAAALEPPDPDAVLLERLADARSEQLQPQQLTALHDAARAALSSGELREHLLSFARMADRPEPPVFTELSLLLQDLPHELGVAVLALGSGAIELPPDPGSEPELTADQPPADVLEPDDEPDPKPAAEPPPDPDPDPGSKLELTADQPPSDVLEPEPEPAAEPPPDPDPASKPDPDPGHKSVVGADSEPKPTAEPALAPPAEQVAVVERVLEQELEDLTPEPVVAGADDGVGEAVAELLEAGAYGSAAWVARAGGWASASVQVIEAAAYAQVMSSATSTSASRYGVLASSFAVSEIHQHRSLQLLALAAAARSVLVASYIGGLQVLESLRPTIEHPATGRILEALTSVGSAGIELSNQLLAGVRDRAELEGAIDASREIAVALLAELPHRRANYHRSTRVWQHWFLPGGALASVLETVAADDRSKLPQVQRAIVGLREDRELSDLIDETDGELTAPQTVRRNPIEANARSWLVRNTQQVLEVADEWHAAASGLSSSDDDQRSRTEHHLDRLRSVVSSNRDAMLGWLLDAPDGRSRFAQGARQAAAELLRTSFDLLLHGTPLTLTDPPVDVVRTLPLLGAPDLVLDGGEPLNPAAVTTAQVETARATDLLTALVERQARGDHESTALILAVLAWQTPPVPEDQLQQLHRSREEALANDLAALERLHERCHVQLRQSRRLGHITELTASQLQTELDQLAPNPDIANTALVRSALERFAQTLDGFSRAAGDELTTQLDALLEERGSQIDPNDVQRVRDLIADANLDTAAELISLLRDGRELPVGEVSEDHLRRLYPSLVDAHAGAPPKVRALLDAIRKRDRLLGLDLGRLSDEAVARATRAVESWYQLGATSPTENRPRLVDVFALLGLMVTDSGVTHSAKMRSDANQQWFDLQDARPFSDATVHQFGSSARGRYRVMVTAAGPSVPRLLEYASAHKGTEPLIVLHIGTLDANARRELAGELRRSHTRRDLIVVDDAVITYLASEGSGRFSTLLACCLPFAGISPYTPYGLGNVPREMFFGREQELQSIQDRFGTLFIYGGRQLGKSALLRAAERDFQERSPHHIARYVDLKARGLGVYRSANEIIDVIVDLLADTEVGLDLPRATAQRPEALVSQLKQWVSEHPGRAMLLLLDEADEFLDRDAPDFRNVTLLKRLFETTGRAVKPVFAGLHQVQRFMSVPNQPLAHLGEHLEIGPLSPQAAFDLVTAPTAALGFRFDSDDTTARVLSHTNYQPGLIQLFADRLVESLMRRPVQVSMPPYPITDDDVARVHQTPDLVREIRKRFELTMTLDPRYRIIAYSLAYSAAERGADDGLTAESLLDESRDWWPTGFQDQNVGSFTTLLDEMVGLGVLRRTRRGGRDRYAMRSPNTLRLLGSTEDIESHLLEASTLELAKPLDINVFHRTIGTDEGRRSSPLDEQQLSRLIAPGNRFLAVLGSAPAGIDAVTGSVRDANTGDGPHMYVRTATSGDFPRRLTQMLKDATEPEAHHILVADLVPDASGSLLGSLDRMRDLVEEHAKTSDPGSTVTIIARVDSTAVDRWHEVVNHPDASVKSSVIPLERWSDHALQLWARHIELPLDDAGVGPLREATGGWVSLIDEVEREWRRGIRWDDALARVRERMDDPAAARTFLDQLGLVRSSSLSRIVGELVGFGSGLQPDDVRRHLRETASDDGVPAATILEVLRALQVIELRADDQLPLLYLDPVTERAWELCHG